MHIRLTARGPVLILDDGSPARISRGEAAVLSGIMARGPCSARELAPLVWPNERAVPEFWRESIGAYVARLRKVGVGIVNERRRGYALKVGPCPAT